MSHRKQHKRLSADEVSRLVQDYTSGLSLEIVSAKYGVSASGAHNILVRQNVPRRSSGQPEKHPVVDGKKQYSKCGESKLYTLEIFPASHGKPGPICRECTNSCSRVLNLAKWRQRSSTAAGGNEAWAREQREYYHSEAGKRSYRNGDLKKKFGITLEQYEERLRAQGDACALCLSKEPKGRGSFHVDHDHGTGALRGLLCHPCNTGLGCLRDDPALLDRASRYLRGELTYTSCAESPVYVARRYRDYELRVRYGITLVQYTEQLRAQGNACAICQRKDPRDGRQPRNKRSAVRYLQHVDHNHNTGAFRGLLCRSCNIGIGLLQDDSALHGRAVTYLGRASL